MSVPRKLWGCLLGILLALAGWPFPGQADLYHANDNLQTISDAAAYGGSQTQSFTYDALHRLKTAQASGAAEQGGYSQKNYDLRLIGGRRPPSPRIIERIPFRPQPPPAGGRLPAGGLVSCRSAPGHGR